MDVPKHQRCSTFAARLIALREGLVGNEAWGLSTVLISIVNCIDQYFLLCVLQFKHVLGKRWQNAPS